MNKSKPSSIKINVVRLAAHINRRKAKRDIAHEKRIARMVGNS